LAGFLAGLDAVEPLSQDADHPNLLASYPRHRGRLANRQVIVPAVVLSLVGVVAALVVTLLFSLFTNDGATGSYVAMAVLVGVLWGVAGAVAAAVSVAVGPPSFMVMVQTPEIAFLRTIASPGVSVATTAAPLLFARAALHHHDLPVAAGIRGVVLGIVFVYGALTVLTSGGVREPDRS
jgi:hypothetical protein